MLGERVILHSLQLLSFPSVVAISAMFGLSWILAFGITTEAFEWPLVARFVLVVNKQLFSCTDITTQEIAAAVANNQHIWVICC